MVIELGLISILGFYNTPYKRVQTHIPSLTIHNEIAPNYFFEHTSELRMNPVSVGRMNVGQVTWDFKAGFENERFTFALGHQSQHGVDRFDPLAESVNYVQLKYRVRP